MNTINNSNVFKEMESFKDKLDSVNKELNEILGHNESVKERLYADGRSYGPTSGSTYEEIMGQAKMGQYRYKAAPVIAQQPSTHSTQSGGTDEAFAAAAAPAKNQASPYMSTTQDSIRSEIREAVAAEARQLAISMQGAVVREWDVKLREVDAILKGRFGELRGANEALQRVVTELADEVAHVNESFSNRLEKLEGDLLRKINAVKREHEDAIRHVKADVRELSDTLVAAKLDAASIEKRADELGKRLQDNISASIRVFDQKWVAIEDQVENNFRVERKQHTQLTDKMEKTLLEHADQLRSDGLKILNAQQEVTALSEEAVGFRSLLRVTRGEVNQLEMLVRSLGVRQQQQQGEKNKPHLDPLALGQPSTDMRQRRDDAPWEGGAMPFGEGIRLQQDVYALKQSVAYLADVVERKVINNNHHNNSSGHSSHPKHIPAFLSKASGMRSPSKYKVLESDEESNVNLARSSID